MFRDRATLMLLGSNLLMGAAAVVQGWPLLLLLWPYWLQSVVIGWFARRRILALEHFSTDNFKINGRQPAATPRTRRSVANFFALHYGGFHLGYLIFLAAFSQTSELGDGLSALDWVAAVLLVIPFAMSHAESHREHVAADLEATRNIGTLMFVPYARVIPMHLSIIFGVGLASEGHSRWAVALFVALKALGDLGMHVAEHRWLQHGRGS